MPSEAELLRTLDDEPDTPSAVDIGRAITAANRRRRARRGAGYAGAAAITAIAVAGASVAGGVLADEPTVQVAISTPPTRPSAGPSGVAKPAYTIPGTPGWTAPAATAPTGCTLERLPVPGGEPMALVSGADPAGSYIVGRSYPDSGGYQAVLWHDGRARNVMLPGDAEELLTDVNAAGTAVGWSYTGDGEDLAPVPYAYRNGKVTQLAGVRQGSAYAINEAGAIVGDDNAGRVLVWPSVSARPVRLPVPAGTAEAHAEDIDEDGTVVGTLDLRRPYIWYADGTHRELPMPSIDGKPAAIAHATGIRNGIAIGMASPIELKGKRSKNPPLSAVTWNLRTGETTVTGGFLYTADGVNAQGWQIGTDRKGYAVVATGSATVRLPGLGQHRADGTATIVSTISDDGRTVAGQSDDPNGTIQAVVWRCR